MNGRIFTGAPGAPWAEVLVVRGDRIAAVGADAAHGRDARAASRVIDAGGRLVIPGINDAHVHAPAMPDHVALGGPPAVRQDPSWDEVLGRIRQVLRKASGRAWIVGEIGPAVLDDPKASRFPLDELAGDRPIALLSWHGHGHLFNTAALRALDISETEPDPPGGFFVRMPDGRTITGMAHEYAGYRTRRRLAMLAGADAQVRAYRRTAAEAASFGITSLQLMMSDAPAREAIPLIATAELPVRVRAIEWPMASPAAWQGPIRGPESATLTVSGVKYVLDGTPIERLMFLRDPYRDAPGTRGRLNFPESDVKTFLSAASEARVQPMFHAVGDAAIDAVLAALEATGGEKWRPLRPRLEHGDMLEPAHFDRAKRMGVTVVQNPSHFMIGGLMRARIGSRIDRTTVVRSIVRAGVPFAIGSDGPLNPFLNIFFATINEVNPEEALTVEEALVAYTRGAAAAEMLEDRKGTLAAGMLADVAILSQDIFTIPPPELPKTASVVTIVGGRVVHETQ